MKYYRYIWCLVLLAIVRPAVAQQQRIIVRDTLGVNGLRVTCLLLNCNVSANLGDPAGQVFLITTNGLGAVDGLLSALLNQVGIVSAEVDQQIFLIGATAGPVPESLLQNTPVPYYGAPVWDGYANQPAAWIVRVGQAQTTFNVSGAGIVAMIDTGVDTQHPALVPVLVPGYNFINNTPGGSEIGNVNQSSVAVLDGGGPAYVNSSTIAYLNQSSVAVLDGGGDSDFGHGTMTAGIVHLVAPSAKIMPLKAFAPDGSGYLSNIIRAAYYAIQNHANIISMSFSFPSSSAAMTQAINYANSKRVICVASVGNDGSDVQEYPAALNHVMGVASTSDYDTRSSFSNYGADVWVAAPGEGVVTTYPYGTYAAGWGTSFSAPFVSGTAALLLNVSPQLNQEGAAAAVANAHWISSDMGNGELDTYLAVQSLVSSGGQQ